MARNREPCLVVAPKKQNATCNFEEASDVSVVISYTSAFVFVAYSVKIQMCKTIIAHSLTCTVELIVSPGMLTLTA